MTEHRAAVEKAVEDVLLRYGLEPASVLGAVASDVYRAVFAGVEEEFAFDHGAFTLPISASDAAAIKSPETRRHLRHAYRTRWQPLDDDHENGANA